MLAKPIKVLPFPPVVEESPNDPDIAVLADRYLALADIALKPSAKDAGPKRDPYFDYKKA